VPVIDRREFLRVGGAALASAGLAVACSQSGSGAANSSDLNLTAQAGDIDLGGVTVRTWTWGNQ